MAKNKNTNKYRIRFTKLSSLLDEKMLMNQNNQVASVSTGKTRQGKQRITLNYLDGGRSYFYRDMNEQITVHNDSEFALYNNQGNGQYFTVVE